MPEWICENWNDFEPLNALIVDGLINCCVAESIGASFLQARRYIVDGDIQFVKRSLSPISSLASGLGRSWKRGRRCRGPNLFTGRPAKRIISEIGRWPSLRCKAPLAARKSTMKA